MRESFRRIYWWLVNGLTVIGMVGLVWYSGLAIVSPIEPDPVRGLIFEVPARRHDFYVGQGAASVLWAFAAEIVALIVVGAFGRLVGRPTAKVGLVPGAGDKTGGE
jgi:hypothetical protein